MRLVPRVLHRIEVRVFGDDPFRFRGDGAVREFVVIRIGKDETPVEMWDNTGAKTGISHRVD